MSKLDELLRELCPDGVEYKKLGEIATKITDGMHNLPKGAGTDGAYPILSAQNINNGIIDINASKWVSREIFEIENRRTNVQIGDVLLTIVGAIGRVAVVDTDLKALFQRSVCVIKLDNSVAISRYVFFALQSSSVQSYIQVNAHGAAQKGIYLDNVSKIVVPLPPIEVQSEIVRILDDYTENVVELQNQLALEITARQRQYTFYRNKLLTFSGNEKAKIAKISLGDIGPICMCKRILKSQTNTVEGVPFYKIGTFGKKADAYISKETFDEYRSKYSFPKKGDVLISAAGTIGRTVVYDGKPAYFQDSNIVWIDNDESIVLNSYLRYCYELKPWKVSSGGTIQRLYNDNVAKAIITVPSLDVQNRIVNVLDNFEKICSDLNIGLPAEIEARQKQYEYYRDKLLTFAETGNTILSRAEQSRAEQSRAEQSRAEQSRAEQSTD